MRRAVVASCLIACVLGMRTASAADCPGRPGALGVSRTIAIDPTEHRHVGSHQYREILPLQDREIVLTFDDGPLPPHTTKVLDILASECLKATFFLVGKMASQFPELARRELAEGHTIANHSQNHPLKFNKFTVEQASKEIEDGFASIHAALGEGAPISNFFRIPGLLRQNSVEDYLDSRNMMTWGIDFLADDWHHHITPQEIVRRALQRIKAKGRGILLLHDIQPATVQALPVLLQELKARGYKIVHVVQAGPSHPKTASEPEQWAARHEHPSPWPRIEIAAVTFPSPALTAPSLQSFAVGFRPGAMVPATLSGQPGMLRTANGDVPAATLWERSAIFTQVPETAAWASPAAENFRYARKPRSTTPALPVAGTASPTARLSATAVVYPVVRPTPAKGQTSLGRGRSTGHQLMLAKPMAHLRATLPTVR